MANQDVYEGKVGLDLQGFLDGLKQMETATEQTLQVLKTRFAQIEQLAKNTMSTVNAALSKAPAQSATPAAAKPARAAAPRAVSQEQEIIKEAQARAKLAQATQDYTAALKFLKTAQQATSGKVALVEELKLLTQISSLEMKIANQKAKAAMPAKAPAAASGAPQAPRGGGDPAAAAMRLAAAQARAQAQAKDYTAAIKTLETAIAQYAGKSLMEETRLSTQLTALRQKQSAQLNQQLSKEHILRQAEVQKDLELLRQRMAKEMSQRQQHYNSLLAAARVGKQREVEALQQATQREVGIVKAAYDRQVEVARNAALRMEAAKKKLLDDSKTGKTANLGIEMAYREAVIAAEAAAIQEAALRKRLTEVVRQEASAVAVAIVKGYDTAAARQKILAGGGNFLQVLKATFDQARLKFKEVEQDWHSIYRGGAQLTQLGGMMTRFSMSVARTSMDLMQSSGDFDFWARRIMAATNVANSQFGNGTMQLGVEDFKNTILEMGRSIGIIDPTELAKGWYTYQAAVGGAVETSQDLADRVKAMDVILRASVITDTAPETIIRGVTSAMAQFGLGVEQTEYALSVMQNTTQLTQADFSDMLEAFKMVGPQASRLGLSIGDVAAVFGTLADNGIRGSQAGRLLSSGMTNLVRPTKQMSTALQDLFVTQQGLTGSWQDLLYKNGQFVGLYDEIGAKGEVVTKGFLSQAAEISKGLSPVQFENYIATIFGKESGKVFGTLITAYRRAADEIDTVPKALRESWKSVVAATGESETAIVEFANRTAGMNPLAQSQEYIKQFGTDGLAEFLKLQEGAKQTGVKIEEVMRSASRNGLNEMQAMAESLNDPDTQIKAFGDQWKTVSESSKIALGQLTYAFDELKERLGTILMANALPVLDFMKRAAYAAMEWAKQNPEVANGLVKLGLALTVIIGVLGPLLAVFGLMAQGIASLAVAGQGIGIAFGFVKGVFLGFGQTLRALVFSVFTLNLPLMGLAALLGFLYAAWQNNWGGMRESAGAVIEDLKVMLGSLGVAFNGVLQIIAGAVQGNTDLIKRGFDNLAAGLYSALVELPGRMIGEVGNWLGQMDQSFENYLGPSMSRDLYIWGRNAIISFVNGITSAMGSVWDAVSSIAEAVARPFRSYSPPKFGPLRKIKVWGKNLIGQLVEGMSQADLSGVIETAERIGEAIKRNVQERLVDVEMYGEYIGLANNLADDMLATVRQGGRVGGEFFEPLREGLGEWYEYIKEINLAYQDVYANERSLKLEQERLRVLKAQNDVLRAQARERQSIFEKYLSNSNAQYSDETNQKYAVDPRSQEGKAKIEEMRRTLNTEDFQNWINFQKRLWEARDTAQEEEMKKEEETQQTKIDTVTAQLAAAKEQYELYKSMYDYAVKMYNLAKEQADLKISLEANASGGGGGGGSPSSPLYGTPEQMAAYLKEIEGRIGSNTAIKDETMLRSGAADDIATLGDAAEQRMKEEQRLSELEKMNRRKRAEYEAALINATTDEERKRIKENMDAWDAAYKEQKAQLQERVSMTKEVEEATIAIADASKPGRIAEMQTEFQEQIVELLGEQTAEIADANDLASEGVDIEEAQKKAKEQTRTEERKLRDLQAEGDRRRLEYEERIREAANDPEKVRRIQEEQEAWEAAYKKAVEAQQARVEASRRTEQDLQEVASEQKAAEKPAAAKPIGGGGGGPVIPDPDPTDTGLTDPTKPAKGGKQSATGTMLEVAKSIEEAKKKIEEFVATVGGVKKAFDTLREEIGLGPLLLEILGEVAGILWAGIVGLGETMVEGMRVIGEWLVGGIVWMLGGILGKIGELGLFLSPIIVSVFKTIGEVLWAGITGLGELIVGFFAGNLLDPEKQASLNAVFGEWAGAVGNFILDGINGIMAWLFGETQWNDLVLGASGAMDAFWADVQRGWGEVSTGWGVALAAMGKEWDDVAAGWGLAMGWIGTEWAAVSAGFGVAVDWIKARFAEYVAGVQERWNWLSGEFAKIWEKVSLAWSTSYTDFTTKLDTFMGGLRLAWEKFWPILELAWTTFSALLTGNWALFWAGLQALWQTFSGTVSGAWGLFWDALMGLWNTFDSLMTEKFGTLWENVKTVFFTWVGENVTKWTTFFDDVKRLATTFVEVFTGQWGKLWDDVKRGWDTFADPFNKAFGGIMSSLGSMLDKITSFASALAGFRFPSVPSGGGGGGGGGGSSAPSGSTQPSNGSHAQGLAFVPFDGYRATLHKGERVLTAKDNNVLGSLIAQIQQALSTVQTSVAEQSNTLLQSIQALMQAQGQAQAQTLSYVTQQYYQQQKSVVMNVGAINAEDPEAGRRLLNQLAFLS